MEPDDFEDYEYVAESCADDPADATIQLLDQEGITEVTDRLEGLDESPQMVQNLLLMTCVFAQGQGIEYTSFIEMVTKDWSMADKLWDRIYG